MRFLPKQPCGSYPWQNSKVVVKNISEILQTKIYLIENLTWSILFLIKNIYIELPALKLVSMTIM